jgi:hypothetical protein
MAQGGAHAKDLNSGLASKPNRAVAPIARVAASRCGFPSSIVNQVTLAIDRGDRGNVAMVIMRHQCFLLRSDMVEVDNHEANAIAELRVKLYQTLGLACGVPAVGGSKEDHGCFARGFRTFGEVLPLDREVRARVIIEGKLGSQFQV